MEQDEPTINGIMLRNRMRNLSMLEGRQAHDEVAEALPKELGEGLRYGRIIAGGWYPIAWLRDLHRTMEEVLGLGETFARKLGYYGSKQNFRGVHRGYAAGITPGAMMAQTAKLYRVYYRCGEMSVHMPHPRVVVGTWTNCRGFDSNLWGATLGSSEALLEMCGIRNLKVDLTAGGGPKDHAEITASWEE